MTNAEIYAGLPCGWNRLPDKERDKYYRLIAYRRAKSKGLCPSCHMREPEAKRVCCRPCIDASRKYYRLRMARAESQSPQDASAVVK